MVTLKDIAKLANVDQSTVSRALNNTGYVHPDTKLKILEAANQLSYKPNIIGKALREGKRNTIGVVVPRLRLSVFGELVEVIESEAAKKGYEILIGITQDNPTSEKECLDRLRNGFIDGLIIASTGKNKHLIRDIEVSDIPVIQLIREHDKYLGSVIGNYYDSAFFSVNYLASKGCTHIGFINGPVRHAPYEDRHLGYLDGMKKNGLLGNLNYTSRKQLDDFEDGYQNVDELLKKDSRLQAVLVANDSQGIGVLRRLKEKRIQVPTQIKVMSLTGNSIGGLLETSLTAMEIPGEKMGKKIVSMIIERMEKGNLLGVDSQRIVLEAKLIERETTC